MTSGQKLIDDSLEMIKGSLAGDGLINEFKNLLIEDPMLRKLFGAEGQAIFVNVKPSFNTKVLPSLELWWGSEKLDSPNGYLRGTIDGRIIFPADVAIKVHRERIERSVVWAIIRYMDTENFHKLFSHPGLVEFGTGLNANYSKTYVISGASYPAVTLSIPYKIDMGILKSENPDVDYEAFLNAELFGDFEITQIEIEDDSSNELSRQETNHGGDNV